MDISKVLVFNEVAQEESFTLAAEQLGMTRSKVSRHIQELEDSLEVQLFHRTTRKVSLTQMGHQFHENTKHLIQGLKDAERKLKSEIVEPSGVLRVSFPTALGHHIFTKITSGFLKAYPNVQLEVVLSDAPEDLLSKGIDCAIRGGELKESTLICRHLFSFHRRLYASPNIECIEKLSTVDDLYAFKWVSFKNWKGAKLQLLHKQGNHSNFELPKACLSVNSLMFLKTALIDGVGIGILPEFLAKDPVNQGLLIRVLPDYSLKDIDFYLVYPNTSYVSPALRAFKAYCYRHIELLFGDVNEHEGSL